MDHHNRIDPRSETFALSLPHGPSSGSTRWHEHLEQARSALNWCPVDPSDRAATISAGTHALEQAREAAAELGGGEADLAAHRRVDRLGRAQGCSICAELMGLGPPTIKSPEV